MDESFGKDFGGMAQGDKKTGQMGTNTMFVMNPVDIPNIPKDRMVTYAQVVVDHHTEKADPNRIRITAGGNLINYPGELTTRTADITTAKLLWNSVLSTPGAKYMFLDIKKITCWRCLIASNICEFLLPSFPHGSSNNTNSKTKSSTATYTSRCDVQCGASLKPEY